MFKCYFTLIAPSSLPSPQSSHGSYMSHVTGNLPSGSEITVSTSGRLIGDPLLLLIVVSGEFRSSIIRMTGYQSGLILHN